MRDVFQNLERFGSKPAVVSECGRVYTYEALAREADAFVEKLGAERRLLLIEARNVPEPLIAYIGAMRAGYPVILVAAGTLDKDRRIVDQYKPSAIYSCHDERWELEFTRNDVAPRLHPDLALLLSTSGTTGASKMVTLSRQNLQANAHSIAAYLGIDELQRPVTTLPFYYSYGLSVINSHLPAGATILLTDRSLTEPEFWDFFQREGATSFAGVPYSFELLERIGFEQMDLPSLQMITQAGGRLPSDLVQRYGALARNRHWQFFVMYGQTEATARIAYMPPDRLLEFPECIGQAIPDGNLCIVDDFGNDITDTGNQGQLVYQGPNVMMRYSYDYNDLARGPEIEYLETGDIAYKNGAGFFQIVGRKNRFSKLYGLRVSLDEVEIFLAGQGVRVLCAGDDALLGIGTLDKGKSETIYGAIIKQYGLNRSVLSVLELDEFPLLDNGKPDYRTLLAQAKAAKHEEEERAGAQEDETEEGSASARSVRSVFCKALNLGAVKPDDSFVRLGGDSLTYVEVSLELERLLGVLPDQWEQTPISELEQQVKKRTKITSIHTDVLFRAMAITMIVAQHAGFTTFGGAGFLILLAGLNAARFQSGSLFDGKLLAIGKSLFMRILLPYYLILGAYQAFKGRFDITDWALVSNYVDRDGSFLEPYWFIQAFTQCIALIAVICLVPVIGRYARRSPYLFGILLLGSAVAMRIIAPLLWADKSCLPYMMPMVFYLFALGWCVYYTKAHWQRVVTSLLIAAIVPLLCFAALSTIWPTLLGSLLILWLPQIKIPSFLHLPVSKVAAAIFYIYLVHELPVHLLTRTLKPGWPVMATVAGLVTGIIAWQCVRAVENYSARFLRRLS
ncbi:MAG: AMP-binding protein [Planctomycetota bacterium]